MGEWKGENLTEMLDREFAGLDEWAAADETYQIYRDFYNTVFTPGALDGKTQSLIALAINLVANTEYCIAYHTRRAIEYGATEEEIREIADVALVFGGAPTSAAGATWLREALATYKK
jgi:AhpD family alkylhydroperoxidase